MSINPKYSNNSGGVNYGTSSNPRPATPNRPASDLPRAVATERN